MLSMNAQQSLPLTQPSQPSQPFPILQRPSLTPQTTPMPSPSSSISQSLAQMHRNPQIVFFALILYFFCSIVFIRLWIVLLHLQNLIDLVILGIFTCMFLIIAMIHWYFIIRIHRQFSHRHSHTQINNPTNNTLTINNNLHIVSSSDHYSSTFLEAIHTLDIFIYDPPQLHQDDNNQEKNKSMKDESKDIDVELGEISIKSNDKHSHSHHILSEKHSSQNILSIENHFNNDNLNEDNLKNDNRNEDNLKNEHKNQTISNEIELTLLPSFTPELPTPSTSSLTQTTVVTPSLPLTLPTSTSIQPKESQLLCSICLDAILPQQKIIRCNRQHQRFAYYFASLQSMNHHVTQHSFGCQQLFHEFCLLSWLQIKSTCPLCHYQLLPTT